MSNPIKIYCVNDGDGKQLIEKNTLNTEGYELTFIASGQACLDAARHSPPDLFLLDVMTPNLNGYETCEKIRDCSQLNHTPVIFISADPSIETRLHSYAAGGDDYVIKPFEKSELNAKVKATLKRKKTLDLARKEVSDVTLSTMDIMTSMGEMSTVVHFLQAICLCASYQSLAKKVIKAHRDLGLDVAMQITVNDEKMKFFTDDVENPLEDSVFEYVRSKGRLIDFGQRTAVNFPYVSIIVRNMPVDNPNFHGRIRDHVAIIGQGADSKVKALQSAIAVRAQRESLLNIITQIETTVIKIDADYESQRMSNKSILATVGESLEDSFMSLGLSSPQENYLRGFIEAAELKVNSLFESGLNLEDEFAVILKQIDEALKASVVEDDKEPEEEMDNETITLF
ncbi:hypothetical protein A9Q80_03260 [Cycloclasticus sp. 46_83_sub15_T18]|nr:hypothetical protein A9Q80_03260 [Cycloclasticus sp. 46_83_sub15_T18]